MDANAAWARFLRTVATAANQLATDLAESPAQSVAGQPSPETWIRGERQRAIVGVAGLRSEVGMKTAEIARAIGYNDVPNVYMALRALERRGVVELVLNRSPQHWRLAPHFREETAA